MFFIFIFVFLCACVCACMYVYVASRPLHKAHVGAHIFCRMCTLANYIHTDPQWRSIGAMGTEGSEGATPSDDVPESWGGGPWRRQRYSTTLCRCTSPRRSEGRLVVGIVQSPVSRVQQWAHGGHNARTKKRSQERKWKRGRRRRRRSSWKDSWEEDETRGAEEKGEQDDECEQKEDKPGWARAGWRTWGWR